MSGKGSETFAGIGTLTVAAATNLNGAGTVSSPAAVTGSGTLTIAAPT